MTTAARPTWAPAKGGNEQGGTRIFGPSQKYSSRDLAAHTSLKPRYGPNPSFLPSFLPSMESYHLLYGLVPCVEIWPRFCR